MISDPAAPDPLVHALRETHPICRICEGLMFHAKRGFEDMVLQSLRFS